MISKCLLLFVLIVACCAMEIVVTCPKSPCDVSRINAAIHESRAMDFITIERGTYINCSIPVTISKQVIIEGEGAVIDCKGFGTAFTTTKTCSGAVIRSVTVINAEYGIQHVTGGEIHLSNVTIRDCGTGAYVDGDGSVLLMGGVTIDRSTDVGVSVWTKAHVTMENIVISNSHVVRDVPGGGVLAIGTGTKVNIIKCTISNNRAKNGAGLAARDGAHIEIDKTKMVNNSASESGFYGGAVYGDGEGVLIILRFCTLSYNSAPNGGALAVLVGARVEMYDSIIVNNSAYATDFSTSNMGGAIYTAGEYRTPEIYMKSCTYVMVMMKYLVLCLMSINVCNNMMIRVTGNHAGSGGGVYGNDVRYYI